MYVYVYVYIWVHQGFMLIKTPRHTTYANTRIKNQEMDISTYKMQAKT